MQPMSAQTASKQVQLAIALLFAIPVMVVFHVGSRLNESNDVLQPIIMPLLGLCALSLAISGYLIIKKFPSNITRLGKYFSDYSQGRANGEIHLYKSAECDDLGEIERGINRIVGELSRYAASLENECRKELELQRMLDERNAALIQAERNRLMLLSAVSAFNTLGKPLTTLRIRLLMQRGQTDSLREMQDIDESVSGLDTICEILNRINEVSKRRMDPYIDVTRIAS